MSMPTVYIIDDDEAVRDSIKELVESVKLAAVTFSSAHSFLEYYSPDITGCIVSDIRMARMSGLILQDRLNKLKSSLPVIFITGHGEVDMVVKALKSGALDFIQKPYHEQNLLDSINNALELDASNRNKSQDLESLKQRGSELTTREREVTGLLLKGKTNKSIAKCLEISSRTVEVHRHNILRKYDVKSVMQLAHILERATQKAE